ncbi:MAG: DinB family protein [Bacteroidota bacterium]
MMNIQRPEQGTYPTYYDTYIGKVSGDNIMDALLTEHYETIDLLTSLDEETLQFRYESGKWTIRGIVQHLIDTERIFCYRALTIARNDKTSIPGFDENMYVETSNAIFRDMNDMAREFSVVRASTIELFKSLPESVLDRSGTANGNQVTVRVLLFAMLGHEIHHRKVIEDKYL